VPEVYEVPEVHEVPEVIVTFKMVPKDVSGQRRMSGLRNTI
jgi:hypothetical protein